MTTFVKLCASLVFASLTLKATAGQLSNEQYPPLRIITEHSPPGQYLDSTGKVMGVTVQLIRTLQHRLNEPGNIELMPWARAFEIAKTQTNVALFETARSPEREHLFKWVGPLKLIQTSLYGHHRHFAQTSVGEQYRAGKLIACDYVKSLNVTFLQNSGFEAKRNLILTNKHGECSKLFTHGKVDLIILNETSAAQVAAELQASGKEGLYRLSTLSETELYLAFSIDVSDERIAAWQSALEQTYRDGTMRDYYQTVYSDAIINRLEAQFPALPPNTLPMIN